MFLLTVIKKTYLLMKKKSTLTVMLFCADINSRGTATMFDNFLVAVCRVLFPFILMTKGPQIFHMIRALSNVTLQPLIAFVCKVVSKSSCDRHCNISYNSRAFVSLLICQFVNNFMFSSTVCTNVGPDSPSGLSKMCNPDGCSTKRRFVSPKFPQWTMKALSFLLS